MHPSRLLVSTIMLVASVCNMMGQGGTPGALSGGQILERVSPSTVLILAGRGDGQLAAIGFGLIIRPNGVILTPNHLVKGMKEVQVRLKSGEVYDQVELVAADERRNAAALRIAAVGLPALPVSSSSSQATGAEVFLVSTGAGLPLTASSGVLSAIRMADEVPGAGSGYRLIQFTAPLAPGASGGLLLDNQMRVLGMVVSAISPGQNINFAVPVDAVAGLADASGGTHFGPGGKLQMPYANEAASYKPPAMNPVEPTAVPSDLPRPDQLQIRTLSVFSKTIYLRRERFQDDLRKTAMFQRLGLRFADYGQTADVSITVDRPVLTFDWTYALVYQPSGMTLASGLIEAVDEFDAGPKLAVQVMDRLAAAAVLPRAALTGSRDASATGANAGVHSPVDPAGKLRNCRSMFVESHTVWMKGNLLQDALFIRPEIREWEIRIVDDRNAADVYIDVTRPVLTYDWVYKMIDPGTGTVIGTGKVTAIDGSAAAQRLALDIVSRLRSARSLPGKKAPYLQDE